MWGPAPSDRLALLTLGIPANDALAFPPFDWEPAAPKTPRQE